MLGAGEGFQGQDWEWVGVGIAVGVFGASLAWRLLLSGGRVRVRIGKAEGSIDVPTMLREIHENSTKAAENTDQINRAVNHQGMDEPPLVERVIELQREQAASRLHQSERDSLMDQHIDETRVGLQTLRGDIGAVVELVEGLDTRLGHVESGIGEHVSIAKQWQRKVAETMPDVTFPDVG